VAGQWAASHKSWVSLLDFIDDKSGNVVSAQHVDSQANYVCTLFFAKENVFLCSRKCMYTLFLQRTCSLAQPKILNKSQFVDMIGLFFLITHIHICIYIWELFVSFFYNY
jgi:hypothetical protein